MAIEKQIYPKDQSEQKPKPSNIINFPIKPGTPLDTWWKTNKKKISNKEIVSVEDLAPYLTNFISEKQLMQMSEQEIEAVLQELLEKGVL